MGQLFALGQRETCKAPEPNWNTFRDQKPTLMAELKGNKKQQSWQLKKEMKALPKEIQMQVSILYVRNKTLLQAEFD